MSRGRSDPQRSDRAKAQRKHAKRRAKSRYGLDLNREHLEGIVAAIQGNRPSVRLVQKQSHRSSIWDVSIEGMVCRVVYDSLRKTIVTFLPREEPVDGEAEADGQGAPGCAAGHGAG